MDRDGNKSREGLIYGMDEYECSAAIPPEVLADVQNRLTRRASEQYALAALEIFFIAGEKHLDIVARIGGGNESANMAGEHLVKICRLGWTGLPDLWDFAIWLPMEERFTKPGEYPFARGTPEECLDEGIRTAIYGEGPF